MDTCHPPMQLSAALVSMTWLESPWLLWGVGPVLASNLGFFLVCTLLELLLLLPQTHTTHITYKAITNSSNRAQLLAATRSRIPVLKQVKGCIRTLAGPQSIVNGMIMSLLMHWRTPVVTSWWPATVAAGLLQFTALVVLADLGLYWGHRVQHEISFLWKLHAKHHAIDTPSPYSTLFIHPLDAALQGSIPLALAAAAVGPAPAILYLFIAARLAENGLNHSGVDSVLLNMVTLKLLPLRATAAFHDAHHKYSNHAYNAKNYGESFWVWDWIFGTLSPLTGVAAWSVMQQSVQNQK